MFVASGETFDRSNGVEINLVETSQVQVAFPNSLFITIEHDPVETFADFIFEFWFKDQKPEDLDGAKFEGINIVTKDVTGKCFSIHFIVLNNRCFV